MKRLMCLIIVLSIVCSSMMVIPVMAEDYLKVILNGVELSFDVPPQIIDGRTMVPMRKIFEALGANVEWDDGTKTVTATTEVNVIKMQIDNTVISVNEEEIILDVPPQLVDDRTLVPVRAVAEGVGAEVAWEEATLTVTITKEETPAVSENEAPVSPVFYEINDSIPDYTSITGKPLIETFAPDQFTSMWQYNYDYDEKDLEKYRKYLLENGFDEIYKGTVQYGNDLIYYSDGVEGVFTLTSKNETYLYLVFPSGGTAEEAITLKNGEFYKENTKVPNYGQLINIDPIRFDAGFNSSGMEIVLYLYPLPENVWSNDYNNLLKENGWELAGNMLGMSNGAVTVMTYMKDNELMSVTTDRLMKMITISFEITNEEYSKK